MHSVHKDPARPFALCQLLNSSSPRFCLD